MSRITGTDAFNMMEAYNAVYAPQELSEEQVWEEVENWVNSLVEEGYDLSEYTWEDMYEAYLDEMGHPGGNRPGGSRPITNAPYQSRFARPMNAGTVSQDSRRGAAPSRVTRPPVGLPANYRGQELQQAARARASQVGTTRQGTAGGPTVGGNTPIGPATRPAATAPARPAARPAATAPARPAATAPTQNSARPTATPATTTTPATTPAAPSRPSLRSDIADLQKMRLASQERQRKGGATVVGSQMASFDMFDVVKGHLIDEGYADTEEAALQIMANMSEEWRESILDEASVYGARKGTIRSVIAKGGGPGSIKYVASGGDIIAGDRAAQERSDAAEGKRARKNRENAARLQNAHKKSIQQLNAKSGDGDYDAPEGHHYDSTHSNRAARRRRASGR